ncbi:nitroreductase [Salsuginibacillus halophilus]|uniref:Putative NAD(P)H nitroreductase n=1 Tax=Salsuginibacillus halophilus TaxID=517424 RepID=A0A2P8HXB8_9BACI|nr:nitroreductase [Salsuginibacillus halophilus]PSL50805.1 nitroreductase [Salsuginibacillus halophilus]
MELTEGLKTRRTIHKFKDEDIDPAVIERAIECAVLAPNHKMTEPWHFHVVQGEAKEQLSRRRGELKSAAQGGPDTEKGAKVYEKAYHGMADVPFVVAVSTKTSIEDPVLDQEDRAATACAVQNFMLSAWSEGVGCFWGSGPLLKDEVTKNTLGLGADEEVIAMLFIGVPEVIPSVKERSFTNAVTWH